MHLLLLRAVHLQGELHASKWYGSSLNTSPKIKSHAAKASDAQQPAAQPPQEGTMAEDTAHSFTQPGVTWASAALLQHCRPLSATVHSTQLLAAEDKHAAISDVLWPSHDGCAGATKSSS